MANKKKFQTHNIPGKPWAQLVARAWSDPAYKKRLLAHPAAVLREAGLEVPEGVEIKVLEESARRRYLIIPDAPPEVDSQLSEEDLESIAGRFDTCDLGHTCVPR
jgi:hypothetical protein